MNESQRAELIARYKDGHRVVTEALSGASEAELDAHPVPGEWSAREVVHHLADSETTSAIRLRRLLAEELPVIYGYDQDVYAVILRYNLRDLTPALEQFRTVRATTSQILGAMSDEDWKRPGWHSEHGLYTAETWLDIYAVHAHNHAGQIRRLREALQKK